MSTVTRTNRDQIGRWYPVIVVFIAGVIFPIVGLTAAVVLGSIEFYKPEDKLIRYTLVAMAAVLAFFVTWQLISR